LFAVIVAGADCPPTRRKTAPSATAPKMSAGIKSLAALVPLSSADAVAGFGQ
jgi:hypothetical protein